MGKTKYSRKTLVGKKKNNTMKKKYPKKQKGKKLKNNKKIKMKKKANKIKRKYSLKVKNQRGGGGDNADVDNNKDGVSCSNCLHRMDTKAIIVSKPNKDGNCPKGFKKEGDFCVSTNIKDETIANIKTTPTPTGDIPIAIPVIPTPLVPPFDSNSQDYTPPNENEKIVIMNELVNILEGVNEKERNKKIQELIVKDPDYKTYKSNFVYHALLDYRPGLLPRHPRLTALLQSNRRVAKAVSSSSSKNHHLMNNKSHSLII